MIGVEITMVYLQAVVTVLVGSSVSYVLLRDYYRTQRKTKERPGVLQLNWSWDLSAAGKGAEKIPMLPAAQPKRLAGEANEED